MATVLIGEPTYRLNSRQLHVGILYTPVIYRIKLNKPKKKITPAYVSRWYTCSSRSRRKGLEFSLLISDIKELMESPCTYCGDDTKPSEVDRKDSTKGYTKDNVTPACRRCNTIKNNVVTYDEMMKIVDVLGWRK